MFLITKTNIYIWYALIVFGMVKSILPVCCEANVQDCWRENEQASALCFSQSDPFLFNGKKWKVNSSANTYSIVVLLSPDVTDTRLKSCQYSAV